jgi:enterochelin esterase family protein
LPFDAPPIESNDAFTDYLLKDVLPFVESRYRVAGDRAHRALFGLSLGGAAALTIGLNHAERFSQIAAYSTGGPLPELEKRLAPALEHPARLNAQLRLLWLGCGKDDALFPTNVALAKLLADDGVKATFTPADGVHNWTLWREYFHDTVVKLFQPGS